MKPTLVFLPFIEVDKYHLKQEIIVLGGNRRAVFVVTAMNKRYDTRQSSPMLSLLGLAQAYVDQEKNFIVPSRTIFFFKILLVNHSIYG